MSNKSLELFVVPILCEFFESVVKFLQLGEPPFLKELVFIPLLLRAVISSV
jgi:hypothetical protein